MRAEEVIARYTMEKHPENGVFIEQHYPWAPDGSLITCITVPRFSYEGFEMFSREQMEEMNPEIKAFWK